MEPLFKKILTLNQGNGRKNHFICRCIVSDSDGQPNFCNLKLPTFRAVLRHLARHHKINIPSEIVCFQCEQYFSSLCQLIQHHRHHLCKGALVFNQEDESHECAHCKANLNCISLCRTSANCVL